MKTHLLEIAAVALLVSAPAQAATVTVKDAWFRSLPARLPAGGYFTLHNGGDKAITLTGAESSACGMLMLHKTESANGAGMMVDVSTVAIPARSNLKFAPGGYHLMCMDPASAMKPGRTVSVTFNFSDGTKTHVPFQVKNAKGE
ncbi:MAG: copper chaperone PCu(A)C [Proteobacteria bacterium]|nr:copper chaperone PCu(A)C [Pseudomonadota bacterium]